MERAWQSYEHDIDVILEHASGFDRHFFNLDSTYHYYDEIQRNKSGAINTWAVRFYTSILVKRGLCLYPEKSLVKNIGFDRDGYQYKIFCKRADWQEPIEETESGQDSN